MWCPEHPKLGITITLPPRELAAERVQCRRPGALHHLAFWVESRQEVDRLYAKRLAIGVDVVIPPRAFPENSQPGCYALYLRDPDGLRYEIVTY